MRAPRPSPEELVEQLLAGDRRALARTLTVLENDAPAAARCMQRLHAHTGRAYILGVTGPPGTGKSTLVNELAKVYRQRDNRVGIVAIDPTSPFTGGAILGDRIRMRDLAGDDGIFIRSMATRGSLGGLARATADVARALDAAGFDLIVVETVGAGQSEVEIARTADTVLVVEAPGLGDEVQAIKAGILEIADVLVVNKADRDGVKHTVRALRAMLDLGVAPRTIVHHGQWMPAVSAPESANAWSPPIVETVATQGTGVGKLVEAIERHRAHLAESGEGARRKRMRIAAELETLLRESLMDRLMQQVGRDGLDGIVERVVAREIDLYAAARLLTGE
jgi:LAO/AO transport system kinase